MRKNLNAVITALGALSPTERKAVRAALDTLDTEKDAAPDASTPLFQAMTRLLGMRLSWRSFHNMTAYKAWRRQAPVFLAFMEDHWPKRSKVLELALMTFLLEMLIEYLKGNEVPVSVQTISNNLNKVSAAFDLSFPGYLRAGLTDLIVVQMEQRRN